MPTSLKYYNKLLIFGFGGHARSVADVALSVGVDMIIFIDEGAKHEESFFDFPVYTSWDAQLMPASEFCAFPASGDNHKRKQQFEAMKKLGFKIPSIISPSATIGVSSTINDGSFIGHHAHIGPEATIGRACIINTGAIIEHESVVGDYSHVSINASIAGRSCLGSKSMLGMGACIKDGITVVEQTTIGAGAVVVKPILESGGIYTGIPASKRL